MLNHHNNHVKYIYRSYFKLLVKKNKREINLSLVDIEQIKELDHVAYTGADHAEFSLVIVGFFLT